MFKTKKRPRGKDKWCLIPNPGAVLLACLTWLFNLELTCPAKSFTRSFPIRRIFVDVPQAGRPQRITADLAEGCALRLTLRHDSEPVPIVGPCRKILVSEIIKLERLEPRGVSTPAPSGDESVRALTDEEYRAACELAETVLTRPDPAGMVVAERRLGALSLRLADSPSSGLALAFNLPPDEARDLAGVFVFRMVVRT